VRKLFLIGVSLALVLLSGAAMASTFVAMSRGELVAKADSVIQGAVVELQSRWDEAHGIVVTEALIEVEDRVVGYADDYVKVRTWGGQVDGKVIEAHGYPTFELGERVVLFLIGDQPDGVPRVLGYQQGQYRIRRVSDGSELAVPALETGVRLVSPKGAVVDQRAEPIPLDRLKHDIRQEAVRVRSDVP